MAENDKVDDFDEANAAVLAEILVSNQTSESVRLSIINDILEAAQDENFFETMLNESMTLMPCPHCNHKNHWLIPEEDLNTMGWVSHNNDHRVKQNTTVEDCSEYAESCSKKKTTV